jgi:hypothetical protein
MIPFGQFRTACRDSQIYNQQLTETCGSCCQDISSAIGVALVAPVQKSSLVIKCQDACTDACQSAVNTRAPHPGAAGLEAYLKCAYAATQDDCKKELIKALLKQIGAAV